MRKTFLTKRFFVALAAVILLFLLWYAVPKAEWIAKGGLVVLLLTALVEWFALRQQRKHISVNRTMSEKLSLGDSQTIQYQITNYAQMSLNVEMIDELPYQLQKRDTSLLLFISSGDTQTHQFIIRPFVRGLYEFGNTHCYLSFSFPGLVQTGATVDNDASVEVYPSIIKMKYYDLQVFSRTANMSGIRQIRRLGTNDEFEHIKSYTQGDAPKSINWKATSRTNEVMVNQYQDSRSQHVYCLIDKGRSMRMPFDGLSLLDHAVNSSLVLSNIILKKYDRAGLLTFDNEVQSFVKAESHRHQLQKISSHLYNIKTDFKETDFRKVLYKFQRGVKHRSILLLFTNFEHLDDLHRQLPYLKQLNRRHLLVTIFYANTAVIEKAQSTCESIDDIYVKTFAQKAIMEKEMIRRELRAQHIQTILTTPDDLNTNVINKYLEIKAKRMR